MRANELPAYKSDPAAACSLLPKLATKLLHEDWERLMQDLAFHLLDGNAIQACACIVEAIRRVKEGGR